MNDAVTVHVDFQVSDYDAAISGVLSRISSVCPQLSAGVHSMANDG